MWRREHGAARWASCTSRGWLAARLSETWSWRRRRDSWQGSAPGLLRRGLLPREKREEGGRIPRLYDLPNAAGDFMRDPLTGFSSWKIAGNPTGNAAAKVALKNA